MTEKAELSRAGLQAFFNIMQAWEVEDETARALLGSPPGQTFNNWKTNPDASLSHETLERISHVLGIYKALQVLLQDDKAADAWVKKPNSASIFSGASALDLMIRDLSGLVQVREYLESQVS